jgi:hypothetical protein
LAISCRELFAWTAAKTQIRRRALFKTPMLRLIFILLALALSSCASPGQRLVDLERCAATVPSSADENGQGRKMEQCMRAKGYWVSF